MIIALQTLIFFRESLFTVLEHFLKPYYKRLTLTFKDEENSDDDDDVYAEYDDEKGVVFYPPVYAQRYAAVTDCLMEGRWNGMLEKVIDFGYHDMSFIKYLKDVPGVRNILGVDIETTPLRCSSDLFRNSDGYVPRSESPLQITLFQGNAADPDYRLIGADAVVAIEMIEHMLPHDLERFVHTVFGFIKPRVAIITTPNGDFNVLFKSLEKNGLRRLDHFFEWSREQFSDWCSNIVARYPQYTVTCKGIGPGPADTLHLGCCSQLALFVADDYQKQPDLCLNSLALVAKQPSRANVVSLEGWESPETIDNNLLCIENSVESYTELLPKHPSYMTIILTSPTFSLETLEYADKMLQCNLEFEVGKNFLMFDDEVYYNTVVPRRKRINRVYVIEDVASRLNCSMVHVTKFSKVTQNLLAKNKMDSFAYTREVVDEIKNLTEMLNLNKDHRNNELQNGKIWCNINWGENAPYWNQYYKIVREYSYPFQEKSDDCRILDAISEEINRLIDMKCDESSVNTDKLEIHMDHLMSIVEYITNDVDKVKDILEWNGYEIVDDVLIYPRLVLEKKSDLSEDWQEADNLSDWDTNAIRSISSGNTNLPDPNGLRRLRRVLDQKILRLRSLTNENVIPDLDHIVCRLMKLALYTSKGRQNPPSTIWMQNKLFDLLSLTEKAIERRRRYFLENFTFKAIEYEKNNNNEEMNKNRLKTEDISEEIMSKYQHLIEPSDNIDETPDILDDQLQETELYDSITSNEFKDYKYNIISNINDVEDSCQKEKPNDTQFNNLAMLASSGSFIYMDYNSTSIKDVNKYNNSDESVHTPEPDKTLIGTKINLTSKSKLKTTRLNDYNKYDKLPKISKPRHKKISSKGSKFKLIKHQSAVSIENKRKRTKKLKEHQKLQSKLSKPIPDSLINLCDLENCNKMELPNNNTLKNNTDTTYDNTTHTTSIAVTEKSVFLAIVTESGEETIALRRNVGTDPDVIFDIDKDIGSETVINITNDSFHNKPHVNLENVQSDTIFLNDINEPSTSKGVRNLSTDVQCGPDTSLNYALSPTISYKKITNIYNYGIKIEDSCTRVSTIKKTCDFGMCTENEEKLEVSTNVNIKIKDSNANLCNTNDLLRLKPSNDTSTSKNMMIETTLLKLKIEDSDSEFCGSLGSLQKSHITNSSKNTSGFQIQCVNDDNVLSSSPLSKNVTHKLVRGGVHVHSYKEKIMVSEDVVYQGEWQRTPKVIVKKVSSEFAYRKRALIQKRKQQSLKVNSLVKNLGKDETKKITYRTVLIKSKRENNTNKELKNEAEQQKTINIQKSPNYMRTSRNVVKVFSKVTLRPNTISDKIRSSKNVNTKKTTNSISRSEVEKHKGIKKNYLPLYLRKRLKISNENKDSLHKLKSSITYNDEMKNIMQPLTNEGISKDLLKLSENMRNNINYLVFRNDIETEHKQLMPSTEENNNNLKRSISPQSQNSSTCSSPNSVATVRVMKVARNRIICNQKDSISERSSSGLESDNISSKYKHLKRCKIYKKPPAVCSNKENVPQSSKNVTSNDGKNISKTAKNTFVGKTKSVFMVHANENSNIQSTSTKLSKISSTPVKDLDGKINSLKKDMIIDDRSIPKKSSIDNSVQHSPNKMASFHIMVEDGSVAFNSFKDVSFTDLSNTSNEIQLKSSESPVESIHNTKSSIMSAIRRLLEDKIEIGDDNSQESPISDSETVILNKYELDNSINSSVSLSINTLLTNEESENEVNNSFISATKMTDQNLSLLSFAGVKTPIKELDSFSFKSIESIPITKLSEYYLADNELDNTFIPQDDNLNANLVQDIFDRNDPNKNTNFPGVLGESEFSVNAQPFLGDHVNLIDSETGSLAPNSARLTASEELFVSGRSSDTYESCFFDDDTYVPNWLFDVLSQQQSIEESEASEEPLEVSLFDVNNNTIEPGVGVISGAGDGRGIHSDHSQDSSGRGTSLSSTASSGPENEAILFIDFTAETAHVPTVNVPNDVLNISERNEGPRLSIYPEQNASDVDADVSSMDTDALDSDI